MGAPVSRAVHRRLAIVVHSVDVRAKAQQQCDGLQRFRLRSGFLELARSCRGRRPP